MKKLILLFLMVVNFAYADTGYNIITYGMIPVDALVTKVLGDKTIINRKPGGDGLILLQALDSAPAGTFAIVTFGNYFIPPTINKIAFPVQPFDKYDNVLVINSQEIGLVAKAGSAIVLKENNKHLNIGGMGSNNLCDIYISHLSDKLGFSYTYIPYKDNGQRIVDLEAGRIDMFCSGGIELYYQSSDPRYNIIRNSNVDNIHTSLLVITSNKTTNKQREAFIADFTIGFNKLDVDSKKGIQPLMLTGKQANDYINSSKNKWTTLINDFILKREGVRQ